MTNDGMKNFLPEEQRAAPIISAVKSVSEQTGRSMAQVARLVAQSNGANNPDHWSAEASSVSVLKNGGDDETRTRDLCRDR